MNWAASRRWLSAPRSLGQSAALACLLEASAKKAGNVHPCAAFSDMDFSDFLISGLCIAPSFDAAGECGVGDMVLAAVTATNRQLGVNTNLGTVLLLAPLIRAHRLWQSAQTTRPLPSELQEAVARVLAELDDRDSRLVYQAIRQAKPGGLGRVAAHDVRGEPPADLRAAMVLASKVDGVALQYVNAFQDVCGSLLSWLQSGLTRGLNVLDAISEVQLRWLAQRGDGLIVRKVGSELAKEARHLAAIALEEWLETGLRGMRWHALDAFLRADGHRRNPGTTADLIAAALFVWLTTDAPASGPD